MVGVLFAFAKNYAVGLYKKVIAKQSILKNKSRPIKIST